MSRVGILLFLLLVLAALLSGMSVSVILAEAEPDNNVGIIFGTDWVYDSPEDAFINGQVTGRQQWHVNMGNTPDGTGAPVSASALSLESTLAFDNVREENLVTLGPPTYKWSFGDIPEWSDTDAWVDLLSDPVPVTFTPGFDASRSADKTEFAGPGTQTLTITLTPREVTEGFNILVQAFEDAVVNPVITSPTSGEGILLREEGHSLHIDPTDLQLNIPWTVTVTIQVTPKVPKVTFMPYVLIGWGETTASGTTSGSYVSHPLGDPLDEVGTWSVSAEGSYQWDWKEDLSRLVSWTSTFRGAVEAGNGGVIPTAGEAGNHVEVHFLTNWVHGVDGDIFTNAEVMGQSQWRIADIVNTLDETGTPVVGLKVTLESDLAFDWIRQGWFSSRPGDLTTMGPPIYEWSYDDVPEGLLPGVAYDAYVGFIRPTTRAAPGFDVSRSFDKTVFTTTDTQTMTVTVTPREEWVKSINISLSTREDDLVDPVFVSLSGVANASAAMVGPGGRTADILDIPAELNMPVTITATISVTPKVPEVEYKPIVQVHVDRPIVPVQGTAHGSSFSYTMDDVGTWTVSAEGDYVWDWKDHPPADGAASKYAVGLDPRSRQAGNHVTVFFTEEFIHMVLGDTFNNGEVTGERWWRALQPINEPDETGAPVASLKVTLDTNLAFDGVGRDKLTQMGPPIYEWRFGDLVEEPQQEGWAWDAFVDSSQPPTMFTPGLDVRRSFDKTKFSTPGTQIMTITLTPREKWIERTEGVAVFVHTDEDELVAPIIVSISPTNGGRIEHTPDGHRSGVHFTAVELNTPLTITYAIRVVPKVSSIEYKPYTAIDLQPPGMPASGITTGSFVSHTNDTGTWTFSAEGSYIWHWFASSPAYSIVFLPTETQDEGTTATPENAGLQVFIGIIAGAVIIIGLIIYTFVRKRLRNRAHKVDTPP